VNRLSSEKRTHILTALCEGASVSATARMAGVSKVTVLKLLADVGPVVLDFQQRTLVDLPCKRVQCDEIWSFIHKKQKRVRLDERGRHWGDVWTWTAICADTKLIPCWHVGTRDAEAARTFMEDLASRLAHRVQLSTDGHTPYLSAVEGAFGWNGIDYAMLEKLYAHPGSSPEAARRYSPSQVVGIEKKWVMGDPDPDHVSTSFAEAHNTRMRTNIRRLTRLTNGHSKKIDNHVHAMSLWFMYYNFCRPHETLTKANRGIKTSPAMAADVADHLWKVSEMVALLEATE
jgi:IS1 family transposase